MTGRSSYKLTFMDRHGPDGGLRLKAAGYALMFFPMSTLMFVLLFTHMLGFDLQKGIVLALLCGVTVSGASVLVSLRSGMAAGTVLRHITEGGGSTPYEEQFSREQALVMQRDYAGALASYEERIAQSPGELRARIAAADLYREHGNNPQRAAQLYREVQRSPEASAGQDVYVSNKLADLYLGPLGEPRRALVEFRRLISRYPDSRTADMARMALNNLKPDMMPDRDS